jgi:UV DNA damage endonuclease
MTNKRIGFCCKWSEIDAKGNAVSVPELNPMGTTVAWLNRQSEQVAEDKLWEIVKHNIESARKLVQRVGALDPELRMVRLGSDLLPMYTEPKWRYFCNLPDVRAYTEKHFAVVGELARALDVRLSFHPGQFVVLASVNEGIVGRSIEEFEYHADMARMMGYGKTFQDFKINVHISGKQGPAGIRAAYSKLSPEARNCITIENEENAWGLDDCLELGDLLPIVMDVHHHWVREGEYIAHNDDRVLKVIDSWRGVRPSMHYSISREDYLVGHDANTVPDYAQLLQTGHKKQKLRAHSDYYWNTAVNQWALGFWPNFDIQCESKSKNLASFALHQQA